MDFNVSYVFPFLNPADPNWQKKYKYAKGEDYKDNCRFRDFSLLKYIFRSIELYAPWIDDIFILVQSESQIPEFVRKEYSHLKIITHDQFIPKEYLPTFNSNTIEAFLHDIPGLPEHIIYGNDDLIFLNPAKKRDFFSQNGRRLFYAYKKRLNTTSPFTKLCARLYLALNKEFKRKNDFLYIKQFHGSAVPLLVSEMKRCYSIFKKDILDSLTMFRNLEVNLNQYVYGTFNFLNGITDPISLDHIGSYFSMDNFPNVKTLIRSLSVKESKMACINDTDKMSQNDINEIYKFLEKKFPEKSRFEK